MVRTYSESGIVYKIWNILQTLFEILMLFFASLFHRDPRNVERSDAVPFRAGNSNRPDGGGGGNGGGGGGGPSSGGLFGRNGGRLLGRSAGRNIRGLTHRGPASNIPMMGGG